MLKLQLQDWEAQRDHMDIEVYIVDDGSQQTPAGDVVAEVGASFPINISRIEENIPWNHAAARNLLMEMVEGDSWTILTDIDHKLYGIIDLSNLNPNIVYRPSRYHYQPSGFPVRIAPHSDSYLITKEMFWTIGGYDETFTGYWNGPFEPFRKAMQREARIEDTENIWLMRYGNDHILDANVTEWGRAGSEYDIRNNPDLRKQQRRACRIYKPVTLQCKWREVL